MKLKYQNQDGECLFKLDFNNNTLDTEKENLFDNIVNFIDESGWYIGGSYQNFGIYSNEVEKENIIIQELLLFLKESKYLNFSLTLLIDIGEDKLIEFKTYSF